MEIPGIEKYIIVLIINAFALEHIKRELNIKPVGFIQFSLNKNRLSLHIFFTLKMQNVCMEKMIVWICLYKSFLFFSIDKNAFGVSNI